MDVAIATLIEQAPGLGAAIVIVCLFNRNIQRVSEKCHESQDRASDAIEKNSEVLGGVAEIMRDSVTVVREVKDYMIRVNGKGPAL